MCDFCHAPEHAYDELIECPDLTREGLCIEAQERCLMAAMARAVGHGRVHYAWDETNHEWFEERVRTPCLLCHRSHFKPTRAWTAWTFCSACRPRAVDRVCAMRLHFDGEPISDEELDELRHRERPTHYLLFNDVAIHSTRGLGKLPSRRAYRRVKYPRDIIVGAKPRGWNRSTPISMDPGEAFE